VFLLLWKIIFHVGLIFDKIEFASDGFRLLVRGVGLIFVGLDFVVDFDVM
jgi:hypothetical protein